MESCEATSIAYGEEEKMRKTRATINASFSAQPETAAPKNLVLSLIRRSNEIKTRMQSIAGELGAEITSAVEDRYLHSGALKLVAKLSRMDELKRDAFLGSFDLYRDYALEGGLFGDEHVGDLVEAAEAGNGTALGDILAGNVKKLRRGIKKIPEIVDNDPPGSL